MNIFLVDNFFVDCSPTKLWRHKSRKKKIFSWFLNSEKKIPQILSGAGSVISYIYYTLVDKHFEPISTGAKSFFSRILTGPPLNFGLYEFNFMPGLFFSHQKHWMLIVKDKTNKNWKKFLKKKNFFFRKMTGNSFQSCKNHLESHYKLFGSNIWKKNSKVGPYYY